IFRIYSMTKPLASVAAMMLVEEGRMQLTDPVAKFLPQFAKMDVLVTDKDGKTTRETAKRQMTIQDLLRHTAGFAYGEFSNVPEIKVGSKALPARHHSGIPYDHAGPIRHRHRQGATGARAGHDMGVQHGRRCARAGRRGGLGRAPLRV